ncbi:hypothetical protein J5N97_008378 [Dioscorea zingiberensis]|uniref:methionine--tRNA ligase n=1 Tax=Dioscorea zingiberensis TaxID=325984 RepID=A0A9D5CXD2_9LILI|nr:hypothetical protein J5N97_008378 [Dioscorea zingiberensis]
MAEEDARLPVPGRRNILITSALPYVNNVPHLGNIIGCVLSADVFARFCRLRGYNVIYICGTDEYGTATETKALEEKCSPEEICDKYHSIHKGVYEWFGISFDMFGRTSTPQQTEICQAIFQKLLENGCLSENTMQQPYCEVCLRFLADRLVEGKCPTLGCNYESARGDQCEKCGKLLNPTELVDPKCKVCGSTPHIRDTNHLFLELPLLRERLEEYIGTMSEAGSWSQNAIQATRAWLKEGLKARCITRDLKWGVPVPHEKFKDKVFYVWFDAPIGYISITSCYTPQWEKWWKDPENVELYQFMGKDNVPFHTVMFPSTLFGTDENWTMMKTISVTEYLNYESGKFSKSKGVGIFGNDVKETKIPAEVWRYYLLTNRPEVSDTLFTWTDLQSKLNNELLNNLGNFTNRVLTFIAKPTGSGYNSIIPEALDPESHLLTKTFAVKVSKYVEQYVESMEKVKLKLGLKIAMSLSSEGNAYLQESEFWKLFRQDLFSCSIVMKTAVGVVYLLASIMEPFMPSFSIEVLKQLNVDPGKYLSLDAEQTNVYWARRPWDFLPSGHRIGIPGPLFRELKDEAVKYFREKFAGSQADRGDTEADMIINQLKIIKISAGNEEKQQEAPHNDDTKSKALETDFSISRLDIRVGIIKKVWKHPDADSLYVEEIDVGEDSSRAVVSGFVKNIPMEQMLDKKVCVLCNLEPVNMRGIKSHAMVLTASTDDHTKVELVNPPASAVVGEQVIFPGFSGAPDRFLNSESKIWEKVQPYLHTNADLVACYKTVPFTTSAGVCKLRSRKEESVGRVPPGPWRLPIIGSMHHLLGSLPHQQLTELAKRHGPLMHLKLGETSTIVVSSREAACEMMKTHDLCFSDRHITPSVYTLSYGGKDLIFSRYGDYWRQIRKLCVLELLSQKRVQSFRSIREEEVFNLVRSIYSQTSSLVNISQKLYSLTNDVTTRAVIGDRCKDQKMFLKALDEAIEVSSGFNLADLYPSLNWLTCITRMSRRLRRNQRELDKLFLSIIGDHEEKRMDAKRRGESISMEDEDLLDVLLRIREEGDLDLPLTVDGIKGVIFDLFGAGSETSSNTMEWAMSELMRNPKVMKKAQSEVRELLRGKTKVTEEDISDLKYLELVIKEVLRMHAPVPLLIPRECRESCELMGYQVPAGTRVLVNIWGIGRDPEYWDEPLVFKPERFEGSSISFNGSCFEYIPFGAGRRMCPGIQFGIANIKLALAQLLYYFDWKLPGGLEPQDLDMSEGFGATVRRKSNLLLWAIPRIPCPTTK